MDEELEQKLSAPQTKTFVAGRAWIPKGPLPKSHVSNLRKQNTVKLKPGPYDEESPEVQMYEERDFYIGVARAFYHRTSAGNIPVEYHTSTNRRLFAPKCQPRDDMQKRCVEELTDYFRDRESGEAILESGVGTGKTVMALLVAARMEYATVVLVHKEYLMNQWVERITEDPAVIPGAKVGIFRGDEEEFGEDYDIVIGMIQTLSNRSADHPIFQWPGMIIADEVHRMAAPTFSAVVHKFNAAYRLGVSATLRRKDDGEQVFYDTLGEVQAEGSAPLLQPKVRVAKTTFEFSKDSYPTWIEDRILIRNSSRNEYIAREIQMAHKQGRDILVLSRRVEHLFRLYLRIQRLIRNPDVGIATGSWYVDEGETEKWVQNPKRYNKRHVNDPGLIDTDVHKVERDDGSVKSVKPKRRSLSQEQVEEGCEAEIILATHKKVSEGFDVPRLDTLFVTYPISDPEQETGRILRPDEGKQDPIVTHFVDEKVPRYRAMWKKCRYIYKGRLGVENLR